MSLENELQTYRKELPRLLAEGNANRYVVIRGEELAGVCDSLEAAQAMGYDRFGLNDFLVKKILADEKPLYYSRSIHQCR